MFDIVAEPGFSAIQIATQPGDPAKPSEDWAHASERLIVVLDGATARTETGCAHGVHWHAAQLGAAFVDLASNHGKGLTDVLREGIERVAAAHPQCDLEHPGTPSAGVAILRATGDYLVLGDVSIVAEHRAEPVVIIDARVDLTAQAERAEVDRHLIGTPEKAAALIPMKHAELAARNVPGGYWIAAADPAAAAHALTGKIALPAGSRAAVLTDGAARAVTLNLMTWSALLGWQRPADLITLVRQAEQTDPLGARWPRNKASDDATAVFVTAG
jgi:hypothetical protein